MKYIIEVKRRRSSVTQGSAHVLVNGIEVADFYDEIKLLKKGEHYYGENIDGCENTGALIIQNTLPGEGWVGGIVGFAQQQSGSEKKVSGCKNSGAFNVTTPSVVGVGGIFGCINYSPADSDVITIENCTNESDIAVTTANSSMHIGGILVVYLLLENHRLYKQRRHLPWSACRSREQRLRIHRRHRRQGREEACHREQYKQRCSIQHQAYGLSCRRHSRPCIRFCPYLEGQ